MVKTILVLVILFLQAVVTFCLLLFIYMILALMDFQGGIDGLVGITFIQPILGGILSILTILICLLVGMPIRFMKSLNRWWIRNNYLALFGIVAGILLMVLSFLPSNSEIIRTTIEGIDVNKEIPSTVLLGVGWFMISFFTLHIFPSQKVQMWFELKISGLIGR